VKARATTIIGAGAFPNACKSPNNEGAFLSSRRGSPTVEARMSHQARRCTCGRTIHIPKGSAVGTTWECWTCGTVWADSPNGKPLRRERSRAPPVRPAPPPRPPAGHGFKRGFRIGLRRGAVVGLVLGPLVALYLAYDLLGPVGPVLLVAGVAFLGRMVLTGGRRR
jgi:hypothetical protein